MKYLITLFFKYSYHVVNRGVTHGDELIYLFSAGVFDLTFLDWEIARVISNLWANFVIHGYFHINITYRIFFYGSSSKGIRRLQSSQSDFPILLGNLRRRAWKGNN